MVHEYAIDPTALNNWQRLRFIADAAGVSHGRLISEFPGSWRRTVVRLFDGKFGVERTKLEVQLKRITPHLIPSGGRICSGKEAPWLEHAEIAHASAPFRAIVAGDNPRSNASVLLIDEIDGSTELWRAKHSIPAPRDAAGLADAACLLLQVASDIVFVDPNFRPSDRFLRPFERFLVHCAGTRGRVFPRIRLVVEDKYAKPGDVLEQNFHASLAPLIPTSLKCELVRVSERNAPSEKLHNRYVLTELGGIDYGIGLDDDSGRGGQSDDVHLLEKDHFDRRWRQYAMLEAFNEVAPRAIIVGTKVI